jgi:hypothetical protein
VTGCAIVDAGPVAPIPSQSGFTSELAALAVTA